MQNSDDSIKSDQVHQIWSKDQFEKLESFSKTGSYSWDVSEDNLVCSRNFFMIARLVKPEKASILPKNDFFDFIDPESKNFVLDVMHESITDYREFEVSFNLAHAKTVKVKLMGYPSGSIKKPIIIGFIRDISDQVENAHAIIKGQDLERKRISLDIHDSVGQKLIAIKYKLALIKMLKNLDDLDELNVAMNEVIDEIRAITHNLSSQIVTEIGLKNAIGQLVTETAKNLGAKKVYLYDLSEVTISDDDAKMIYRIIQESLSNAMKHSKAKNIMVSLKKINKQVVLQITDDGKGFNSTLRQNGIGLQNIKERVLSLNGFVKMDSEEGLGTRIVVKIPVKSGKKI